MTDHKAAVTDRRGWKFAVAAALFMAMIAFAMAIRNYSVAAANIVAAREIKMFQGVGKTKLALIQKQLLLNPLEPNLLYGFIAHRINVRDTNVLSKPERRALESLGWQSTIVQTALMQDAITRADEAAVLIRIDGLLRRGKSTEQLVDLLVQIEQAGSDARGKLVVMLSNEPSWRRDFLLAPSGMSSETAILARFATLNSMFDSQLAPTREEVAPIVNSLLSLGDSARAELLWRKFRKIDVAASVPYDPNFSSMAANSANNQHLAMAYEWRPSQGIGYAVQSSSASNGDAVLRLRWDGRGAPVFVRQKLITPRGWFDVIVTGSLLEPAAMRRINFVYYCDGLPPVFYDRLFQGSNGEFIFTGNEAVGCDNPELRLIGNSERDASPVELELSSILIKRRTANSNALH